MVKAMKTKVGNPLRKLVLLKLADNASDQGECWPSYHYIAEQCEISKRAVQLHIKFLEKTGVLTKTVRKGVKGNSSNVYKLNFHLLKPIYNEEGDIIGYLLPSEPDASPSEPDASPSEPDASPSEPDAPPSESDALGGVNQMHPEPVTLEPVNESVSESLDHLSDSVESNETAPVVVDQKFDAKAKRELLAKAFEHVWAGYGRRGSKKPAKEKFLKLKLADNYNEALAYLQNIITKAEQWGALYAQNPNEAQWQPHCVRWINEEKWNDEHLPTLKTSQAQPSHGGHHHATRKLSAAERAIADANELLSQPETSQYADGGYQDVLGEYLGGDE